MVSVPMIMQMESVECGAASLAMVLAYYGKWLPLEEVRTACGVSRDGSSAKNIVCAARNYGFEAKGFRMAPEALDGAQPAIIHWDFKHFVVFRGFDRKGRACVNDPSSGPAKYSMDEFRKHYTGVSLLFRPTERFEPSGQSTGKHIVSTQASTAASNMHRQPSGIVKMFSHMKPRLGPSLMACGNATSTESPAASREHWYTIVICSFVVGQRVYRFTHPQQTQSAASGNARFHHSRNTILTHRP